LKRLSKGEKVSSREIDVEVISGEGDDADRILSSFFGKERTKTNADEERFKTSRQGGGMGN